MNNLQESVKTPDGDAQLLCDAINRAKRVIPGQTGFAFIVDQVKPCAFVRHKDGGMEVIGLGFDLVSAIDDAIEREQTKEQI